MSLLLLAACTGGEPIRDTDTGGDTDTVVDTDTDTGPDTDTDTAADTAVDTDTDTAPVTDVDGDGHDAVAYGGDDCDDASAWVYPGATEYCDTVDQDCDGDPLGDSLCDTPVEAAAAGVGLVALDQTDNEASHWSSNAHVAFVGDVTGDGVDDVLRTRTFYGDALIYAGGTWPEVAFREELEGVWHRFTGVGSGFRPVDAGDVDGDGWADVVFFDSGGYGYQVRWGPFDWGSSSIGQDGVWWPDHFGNGSSHTIHSGADLDGDGASELVMEGISGAEPSPDIELYLGAREHERCPVVSAWGGAPIGDGDGDGITESMWFGSRSIVVVSGAELRGICYASLSDLAVGELAPVPSDQYPVMAVGDWTGDGVEEWALRRGVPQEGDEAIWLLSADLAVSGEFTSDDAVGSWVLGPDMSVLSVYAAPDFDGDGGRDLALEEDWGGTAHIIPHGTPLSVAADLPEQRLRYTAWNHEDGVGDFNNDGFDDLLLTDTAPSGPPYWVNSWIMPGFEVPWEDGSRW